MILLNKTDLVSSEELNEVERRIRAINPYATLHKTNKCEVPISEILDRGSFNLDRIVELKPHFLERDEKDDHHDDHDTDHYDHAEGVHAELDDEGRIVHRHGGLKHYHDEEMQSVGLHLEGAVKPDLFMPWITNLLQRDGLDILRSKGILAFPAEPRRFISRAFTC